MVVNLAYDSIPINKIQDKEGTPYIYTGRSVAPGEPKPSYYYDRFTNMFYPLNGAHISSFSYYKMCHDINGQVHKIPLTQPDFHASLPAVFKKHNIEFETDSVDRFYIKNKKIVYYFSLRYFFYEHKGVSIKTTLINNPLAKKNYLKELLSERLIELYNKNKLLLVLNDVIEGAYYDKEMLNTLAEFFYEIGITDLNNILITTSNPKCTIYNKQPFSIIYWQYFETATQLLFEQKKVEINYTEKIDSILNNQGYKFLFLNNKPRSHRFYLCYNLWKDNPRFFDDFCVSCRHRGESYEDIYSDDYNLKQSYIKRVGSHNWFNGINSIPKEQFFEFYSKLPFSCELDKVKPSLERYYNFWDIINTNLYTKTGIQIITETLIENIKDQPNDLMFLTEKTFKPLASLSPFIIFGSQGILEHLRSQGYKTFNSFWSEEYDNIADPKKRADEIIKIVRGLQKLTDFDFYGLLQNVYPIVKYNYTHFLKRVPEKEMLERIKLFYKND